MPILQNRHLPMMLIFFLFLWQLIINMHTINAVFLFGDAVLNRLVSCSSMVVSISIRFLISFA